MTLTVNPSPRWGASMSELTASNKLVLFGGRGAGGELASNQTYTFDGSNFTLLNIAGPPARSNAAMSYDGTYVTIVGGTDLISNLSDTWRYNVVGGWVKQAITNVEDGGYTVPTMLRNASMAYQSGPGEAILISGNAQWQRHYVKDVWAWQTGAWTQLSPATLPPGREHAAFASNATTAILMGGRDFSGALGDVYKWDGTNFTKLTTINTPIPRYGHSLVFDSSTNLFIMFGGITINNKFDNSTYTFNLGTLTWTKINTPSPSARAFSAMAYHSATSRTVLHGGKNYTTVLGETFIFDSSALTWTQL